MISKKITPFPILTSDRLVLRKILPTDNELIFSLRMDPDALRYIKRVKMTDVSEADAWIARINTAVEEGHSINWAITLIETGEFLGLICLWNFSEDGTVAEVGYELFRAYHGNGFMDEALKNVLAYGFGKLALKTVEAFTHRENSNSIRLLVRNSFVWEKDRTDEGFPNNVIYVLDA